MHYSSSLLISIVFCIIVLVQLTDGGRIPKYGTRDGSNKQRSKRDLVCPAPYHVLTPDDRCVWSCSEGTTPDLQGIECVCQTSLYEIGTDQFGRRICGACQGLYHVATDDNRCVWSCSEGTTPDLQGTECICQTGLYEIGSDQFGRRICGACEGTYHVPSPDGRCVWSCSEGTTPDLQGTECICQTGLYEKGKDQFGRRICGACEGPYHVQTDDNRCVWSCSQGTTPDLQGTECICQPGLSETGVDEFGRRVCKACEGPYHVWTDDHRCVWSCGQGTTPSRSGTECVCQTGLYEIGHDQLGRRVCGACKGPYHVLTADKRCVWSCSAGMVPNKYGTDCITGRTVLKGDETQ